jgi:hypothetical protein
MAPQTPTRRVRPFRHALLGVILATAGLAFQAGAAEYPRGIHEWEPPARVEPGYPSLDCDPDILIWKRFCPDCVPNRPLEYCSDAALR